LMDVGLWPGMVEDVGMIIQETYEAGIRIL
jgi:hypothetical protein